MQFSLASCHFFLVPNILLSSLYSNIFSLLLPHMNAYLYESLQHKLFSKDTKNLWMNLQKSV